MPTTVAPPPGDDGSPAACATDTPPFGHFPPPLLLDWTRRLGKLLPIGPRAAVRRTIKRIVPPGTADVTVGGVRFRCEPAHNKVDFDLVLKRRFDEQAELDFLADALRPGDLFVDIGANIGVYTLWALLNGPAGVRALAIEPHPELRARLRLNLGFNDATDHALVAEQAVGPDAMMTLWANSARNAGRSSLLPFAGARPKALPVRVRPLADILAAHGFGAANVVKIDIEGFEDRALLPFLEAAPASARPRAIIIETLHAHVWERDALAVLTGLGYTVLARTPENSLLWRGDADSEPPQAIWRRRWSN